MSAFGDKVAAECTAEWELFDRGRRKEYQKKVFQRIGAYWNWPLDKNKRIGDHDPRSPTAKVICVIACSLP